MRRLSAMFAVAALTLLLGPAPAAFAQATATSLPLPAGQGGPDNGVNNVQQGATAPGGADNPAVDAGPATGSDGGSSLAPWLAVGAVLVVLATGAAVVVRRAGNADRPSGSRRRLA